MFSLKLTKHKNFIDLAGHVMQTNEIWTSYKAKDDELLILDEPVD
jgi:hypothetical protein